MCRFPLLGVKNDFLKYRKTDAESNVIANEALVTLHFACPPPNRLRIGFSDTKNGLHQRMGMHAADKMRTVSQALGV